MKDIKELIGETITSINVSYANGDDFFTIEVKTENKTLTVELIGTYEGDVSLLSSHLVNNQ